MDADYNPRVYNFVIPDDYAESLYTWGLNSYEVECPSPSVLLDHSMAVIWNLFNDNGSGANNLNRSELVWALNFLDSIDTTNVADPTVFNEIISVLRKYTTARYAQEDEESILNETQSFLDKSIAEHDTSSFCLEEFYSFPEVQADCNQKLSIVSLPDVTEGKCTKAELTQELKDFIKKNPQGTIEDLVKMLEK